VKKLTINLDAVVIIILVLIASLGMNVWQIQSIKEVTQKYVDAKWELGNTEADAAYVRKLLENCDPGTQNNL
jgi:hypothetical protein